MSAAMSIVRMQTRRRTRCRPCIHAMSAAMSIVRMSAAMSIVRLRRRLLPLSLLMLTVVTSGCADLNGTLGDILPSQTDCTQTADCTNGRTCQLNRCVYGQPGKSLLVGLYVTPLSSQDRQWTETAFPQNSVLTGSSNLELTLPQPAVIDGRIQFAGGGAEQREGIQATVFLVARGGIVGKQFQTSVLTDERGNFYVEVPPGDYEVSVIPVQREDIPERSFAVNGVTGTRVIPFVIPRPESYVRWQGRVVHQTATGVLMPIPNATVYAVAGTNETLSTRGTTDAQGIFTLFVDPANGPFEFQVRPPRSTDGEDELLAIPSASFESVSPVITSQNPLTAELPGSGDLIVGVWDQAIIVRGEVRDAAGAPVANVRITARSDDLEPDVIDTTIPPTRSAHTYRTSSDDEGKFRLLLLNGLDYTVYAASRDKPAMLSAPLSFVATDKGDPLDVRLVEAGERTIQVSYPARGAEPPGELTVRAAPLVHEDAPIANYGVSPDALQVSTTTSDEGTGTLPIFNGNYRFELTHPTDRSIAPTVIQNFVGTDDDVIELTLARVGVIQGKLSSQAGTPVGGATIEAYLSGRDGPAAIATSAADGRFTLILPTD